MHKWVFLVLGKQSIGRGEELVGNVGVDREEEDS